MTFVTNNNFIFFVWIVKMLKYPVHCVSKVLENTLQYFKILSIILIEKCVPKYRTTELRDNAFQDNKINIL